MNILVYILESEPVPETLWQKINNFLVGNLGKLIITVIILIVYFILLLFVKIIINKIISRKKNNKKRAETVLKLFHSILKYAITFIVLITILGIWGVEIVPLLAGAGIIGLVIGLGAQDLIKDLLAGVSIIFENYYDVGDVVEIKEYRGTVIEIGLKSTRLVNWAGEVKIFANGDITEVINFSKNPTVAAVEIAIDYKEDITKVMAILEERMLIAKEMFPQIIEGPNIMGVSALKDNYVIIRIHVKTKPYEHFAVERGLRKYIKEVFDEHSIAMPIPHMVIYDDKNQY